MGEHKKTSAVVVVESPAKARTIEKYLGRGYKVLATYGHVRDLPKKNGSVDPEHDFAMIYEELADRKKRIDAIAEAVARADKLILATDPDREGEAIAWHLLEVLKARGVLEGKTIERITFHEITKKAVQEALAHPRGIDQRLVDAQQARRALDYLVGFHLSPVLWRRIRGGLSAGRVQSAALRLICEREEEIRAFKPREYWTVEAELAAEGGRFTAELKAMDGRKLGKFDLANEEAARRAAAAIENADRIVVARVERKQRTQTPPAPFITSTLQMEAARKLGFSAAKTMQIAQRLYEGLPIDGENVGLITYMRTDSVALADEAVAAIRDVIAARFGRDYLPARPRRYKTTTRNAQEAHEAIRPTDPARTPEMLKGKIPDDAWKLYTLIWQRAVACQMSAAKLELVTAHIEAGSAQLTASGSTVVFDGYRRLYEEARDEKEAPAKILPPLREQEELRLIKVMPKQHFTEPKPRYTEASLIRELEKQGVGRPSTYAAIIDVLKKRGYVRVEKRRFHPTDVGEVVNRFLVKHFPDIVNIGFTAQMEEKLDAIARGEEPWKPVLRAFWVPFSAQVDKTLRETTKKEVTTEPLDEACPECGRPLVVRLGRYGRFIGCSGYPECSYTREREEAEQEAADAPACAKCGAPMQKKRGRFGAFWGCSRYPECDHTEPLVKPEATGIRCPACGEGEIVRRRSRRGRAFWGCSRYPECRFVLWDEPVAKGCPECGHPFVVRKRSKKHGTQLVCPNEGCAWQEAETSEHAA